MAESGCEHCVPGAIPGQRGEDVATRTRTGARRWLAWSCALLLLWLGAASAQPVTAIDGALDAQMLGGQMLVIVDPFDDYAIDAVAAGRYDERALQLPQRPPSLGYPRQRYWVRFALKNEGVAPVERLLLLRRGSKFTQEVLLDDGLTRRQVRLGVGTDLPSGDLPSRHALLRFSLQPGQTLRVTASIATRASLVIDYRVLSERRLSADDRAEYLAFGALGGFALAIAAYLLAIGIVVRQQTYLSFAVCGAASVGYAFFFEGFFGHFAMSELALRTIGVLLGLGGSIGGWVHFVRAFLDTAATQPRLERWLLRPLTWASPVLVVATLVQPWPFWEIGGAWTLLCIAAVIAAVSRSWLGRRLPVRSFAAAILIWFGINSVFILQLQGLIPDSWHTVSGRLLALAIALLTFAFAVSERLRRQVEANHAAIVRNQEQLAELVDQRTGQYRAAKERAETALGELQRTQQQLVQSEKMASLGQLVAGVAHEVNTPLGVALTASSHLEEKSHEVAAQLQSGDLRKSALQEFIGTAEASSVMILRNLHRAAHLIQSFKQVSVDRTSDGRRRFNVRTFVNELVESVALTWKGRPLTLAIECPSDLQMDSFPGALGQVLSNMIQNALLHAFEVPQVGEMRIAVCELDAAEIELRFSDNGKGASPEVIAHLFEPFFTTKRNQGGTGLGLHVAFNLVAQKLGGSISVEGAAGSGLCFCLRLPRRAP